MKNQLNKIKLTQLASKTNKASLCAGVVCVSAFLAASPSAQAVLIAYDGFGSGANNANLAGLGGGTGFSGNWTFSTGAAGQKHYTDAQPGNPSYFYPSNVPLGYTSGATQDSSTDFSLSTGYRTLASSTVDLSQDGQYFISFIYRDFAASPNHETTFSFANATSQLHFGYRYSDSFSVGTSTASQRLGDGTFTDAASTSAGNTTYFIVGQVIASAAGNDQIFLKAYNASTDTVDLSAAAVSWTVTTSINSNQIFDRIGINSAGPGFATLDELRVGTEWKDVTGIPEPSSAALLGFVGLTLLIRRRK